MLKKTGQVAWTDVLPLPKSKTQQKKLKMQVLRKRFFLLNYKSFLKLKKKKA